MQTTAITYRNGHLEARVQNDVRTVRVAIREARARYLDLALAELVGDAPDANQAAGKLLSEMAEVVKRQQHAVRTVRLANREARARYLDLALAELLGNAPDANQAAARLLSEMANVGKQQEASLSPLAAAQPRKQRRVLHSGACRNGQPEAHASIQPRKQRRVLHSGAWKKPLALGLRVITFALVAGTAFMLTTWVNTLR
jgi:hypothetical protein